MIEPNTDGHIKTVVMSSAAGWYVGQVIFDAAFGCYIPYSRGGDYHYSRWEVQISFNGGSEFNFIKAFDEVATELTKAQSLRDSHRLIPTRIQFLEEVAYLLIDGIKPSIRWNYSMMAEPEDAIIRPARDWAYLFANPDCMPEAGKVIMDCVWELYGEVDTYSQFIQNYNKAVDAGLIRWYEEECSGCWFLAMQTTRENSPHLAALADSIMSGL